MSKRCMLYARISVSQGTSVSVERQLEAGRQYAAARGWTVVGEHVDDGVSASHNAPGSREGWRALLAAPEKYDVVVILAIDRLSRRLPDWTAAHQALHDRGAGLVAVEQSFDTTTASGRFMANLLAVFAEYEAEAIAARVKAARNHLIHAGRVVGGSIPYGWRSVPNPDGPGLVLEQDPERIDYVVDIVNMVAGGATIYAAQQYLDAVGAPVDGWVSPSKTAAARRKPPKPRKGGWRYSTVERLLRNPVLAGMTAWNPGNQSKVRGLEVLRDLDGLPVVDESVAILSVADWRALVASLDDRDSAQSRPRPGPVSSPLLSGLVWCQDCQRRMHRANIGGREGYTCPGCSQSISNVEDPVVEQFLHQKGERVRWTEVKVVHEGGAAVLPEIERRLADLRAQIDAATDSQARAALRVQEGDLLDLRDLKRQEAPEASYRFDEAGWFGQEWEAAGDDPGARREVLDDALTRIWVRRGATGRQTPAKVLSRLTFDWKHPEELGPVGDPEDW